jgi:hypothetical protein
MGTSLRPLGGSSNPARARSGVSLLLSKPVLVGLAVASVADHVFRGQTLVSLARLVYAPRLVPFNSSVATASVVCVQRDSHMRCIVVARGLLKFRCS